MYNSIFVFLVIFISVYIEVLFGSFGILLTFTAFAVFYLAVTHSVKIGVIIGIIAGITLDMLYGRTMMISPFSMIFIAILGHYWLFQGEIDSLLMHFLPGAATAFISVFPIILFNVLFLNTSLNNFINCFFAVIAGGAILPFYIAILDHLAGITGLTQYKTAKQRMLDEMGY
jgi:cell shape-determining protein MreD